ncbi:MAG: hypothetical protein ACJASY_002049 [Halioglobus sp.]|jgi:hypothetical protein
MKRASCICARATQLLTVAILLIVCQGGTAALAQISVELGPTAIPRGEAKGERDITVSNGLFALAFAVDSAPPWGVARGGIVDIAIIRDGVLGNDFVSLVDFMPNNWSAWPSGYQQVEIIKQTERELTVRTRRDWAEVELETRFHLQRNDPRVHIKTIMRNGGDKTLPDLETGYVAWPDGGYLFGVPGQRGGASEQALANWSASYDENWVMGLHAPFAEISTRYGRDRYHLHDLAPGEEKTFEAWVQIENRGDLATLVNSEIEMRQLPAGTVSGEVRSEDGALVDGSAVVVLKDGKPYTWTLCEAGRYTLALPRGAYTLYGVARAHAPGPIRSINLKAGASITLNHDGLQPPGLVSMSVTAVDGGQPLDARVSIRSGHKPLIKFFGEDVFFTELNPKGRVEFAVAPGVYEFEVSAGGGFTAESLSLTADVKSGTEHAIKAKVTVEHQPPQQQWYAVDLHHHSDVLDGYTAPEYVLRSELASGMDYSFLSDHNSMVNNAEMSRLSASRSIPFVGGTELSASWAHFNAYPVTPGREIDIDVGKATVQEIFALARRLGAELLHVNHPYSQYGYFRSLETEVMRNGKPDTAVPGGYDPAFDLAEIQPAYTPAQRQQNLDTLARVWQLWNVGKRAYLVGASDVHDVWKRESGAARTYVHITQTPDTGNLVTALKEGRSYATQGPLIFPKLVFGSDIDQPAGTELALEYQLAAVSGLRSVTLIEKGSAIQTRDFKTTPKSAPHVFTVNPRADTWYSLIVEDANGNFAYSNPVWVTAIK